MASISLYSQIDPNKNWKAACLEHSIQKTALWNAQNSADMGSILTSAVKYSLLLLGFPGGMMGYNTRQILATAKVLQTDYHVHQRMYLCNRYGLVFQSASLQKRAQSCSTFPQLSCTFSLPCWFLEKSTKYPTTRPLYHAVFCYEHVYDRTVSCRGAMLCRNPRVSSYSECPNEKETFNTEMFNG